MGMTGITAGSRFAISCGAFAGIEMQLSHALIGLAATSQEGSYMRTENDCRLFRGLREAVIEW